MHALMLGPFNIHTLRQVNWVLRAGWRVTLVSAKNPFPQGKTNFRFEPQIFAHGATLYKKLLPKERAQSFIDWLYIVQYRRLLKRTRPSIVHVNWISEAPYYLTLAKAKPLLLSVWGTDINSLFFPGVDQKHRRRVGIALASCDVVIVDSTDIRGKCETLAGKGLRTELLRLGIDTALFSPRPPEVANSWKRKLRAPESARILMSIRACADRYGHDLILDAFARAQRRLDQPAILVFRRYNEEDDSCEESLHRHAESLGISSLVRWLDRVEYEELPDVYAMSDLIVNYPRMDAFPVTFLEAAACCRRVISCELPAYKDTFAENFFHMVAPENVEQLATALVTELNRSPEEYSTALIEARKTIEDQFSEKVSSARLLEIYNNFASTIQT